MKRLKFLFTALLLLCSTMTFAHDFEVDGIYYNITDATNKTVAVTYSGSSYYAVSNEYTGCVVIPESIVCNGKAYSVTSIGDYAFRDCWEVTSITIPNSVTSIGSYAFEYCYELTSVIIGNGVTSIGNDAFNWCSGLTSVTIGNGVTSIGNSAFGNCSGMKEVHINDLSAWCNISFGGSDANPMFYANNLYLNGELVTDLVIPNSVTSIGDYAFEGCSGLTSVTIPNSVTSIGDNAFYGCSGLTSIEIPNSVTSIGEWAFGYCTDLTSIEIPNSVISIENHAFYGCSGLTSIVVEVGNRKYDSRENCNAIIETESNTLIVGCMNTVIPNSVTSIGLGAFYNCSGLTSVTIGNSVTSIGWNAFCGCKGLTSVTIGNSVTSIGDYAFYNCSRLISIEIPNSVTSIGYEAFEGTVWYNNQPDGVVYAGNVLYAYKGTMPPNTSVLVKDGTLGIAPSAFRECSRLTSIEIPNSVTSIGWNAFCGCKGLTSVTIGNSVTSIGSSAFCSCKNLTDVYCLATDVPSTSSYAFDNSYPENITLHVPAEAINSYQTTVPWSSFGNIVALKEEIVETLKCATPVIEYNSGKLTLECDTENAEIVTKITSNDINSFYGNTVELSATYNISVYATASGYENSDTINAALCWIECDCDANVSTDIIDIPAKAVLVTSNNGTINITCSLEGESVELYTSDAMFIESTTIENGCATIESGLSKGDIAIVKIGEKSIKVIID